MTSVLSVSRWIRDLKRAIVLVGSSADTVGVFSLITLGYFLVFLLIIGDVAVGPVRPFDTMVVPDPLSRVFQRTGPFVFERIARLDILLLRILVSPINILIGLSLGVLVGLNLAVTYLAVLQPKTCGLSTGSGIIAAIPALLSGTVCCGPVILIILGIQASALLLSFFAWLLPLGVVFLLGSLIYIAGETDGTRIR